MKKTMVVAALGAALYGNVSAAETYVGYSLTSNYISSGRTLSDDKPAFQFYLDHQFDNGLYIGIWNSTTDIGTSDKIEIEPNFGYRGSIGKISYNVGYVAYYYDKSHYCCEDIFAKVYWGVNDKLTIGAEIFNNLDGNWVYKQKGSYALEDGFKVDGMWQYSELDTGDYWTVGLSKAFDNGTSARVAYHDRTDARPKFNISLNFDTTLFK